MNRTTVIVGAIILGFLLIAGVMVSGNKGSLPTSKQETQKNESKMKRDSDNSDIEEDEDEVESNKKEDEDEVESDFKQFTVEGGSFYFKPNEIRVKQGDKVKITLKNAGGTHDFVIDEFNIKTKQFKDGETEKVEFTANQKGTFNFYCSVGQHRQLGMEGTLIVE